MEYVWAYELVIYIQGYYFSQVCGASQLKDTKKQPTNHQNETSTTANVT